MNRAFSRSFAIRKEEFEGEPWESLGRVLPKALFEAIRRPKDSMVTETEKIRLEDDRSFEIRRTSLESGGLDLVLVDLSRESKVAELVERYISRDLASLEEEDLRTFSIPERRFMTVSFTDLRGFTKLSEQLPPEEVRTTINAYLEEVIHAIDDNGATVDKIVGDEVMALYGAPRYHHDHALRAVTTACDQLHALQALQKSFARVECRIPPCGIGIHTGEMVLGNMGSTTRQDYTVIGAAVNLASRLCDSAGAMEILASEATIHELLQHLPMGWSAEHSPEDHNKELPTQSLLIKDAESSGRFRFQWIDPIKVKGIDEAVKVVRVHDLRRTRRPKDYSQERAQRESEKIFGRCRLMERLGRGGMGEVWKAQDDFGNLAAVKMLLAGQGASEAQVARFKREAEVLRRLHHPGICRILEVGRYEGIDYIAMEYIEGVTLSEHLHTMAPPSTRGSNEGAPQRGDRERASESLEPTSPEREAQHQNPGSTLFILPFQNTVDLLVRVAQAVDHAHRSGVLHRDIKPSNIMIRQDGSPVVMDFGLAKFEGEVEHTHIASLSLSGTIVGTMETMAPEQARSSKDVDGRADVYSLGAIAYRMLTGHRHFHPSGSLLRDAADLESHIPPTLVG